MSDEKKNIVRAANVVLSPDEMRAMVIQELGLEMMKPQDREEIMNVMSEAILTRVQTAILRALGAEGLAVLNEIPETNDKLFSDKLSTMLPDLPDIVRGAVRDSIMSYQQSVGGALR